MDLLARSSSRVSSGMRRPRRRLASVAGFALASLTVTGLVSAPSASAAASGWGACYRQNSWSFSNYTASGNNWIRAWHNTNCSGSSILGGQVTYNSSSKHVGIVAYDYKADNYAVTVYTHGPSVTSEGNNSSVTGGGSLSSFTKPYNFWIRVGGQENSVSQPFVN